MIIDIDGLQVPFPHDSPYPEQLSYMHELKRALDANGPALLEMPSGTGKTISLLSLITAYQSASKAAGNPPRPLIYCSRTVGEVEKTLQELQRLQKYKDSLGSAEDVIERGNAIERNNERSDAKETKNAKDASKSLQPKPLHFIHSSPILAVGLSARKNMCINEQVLQAASQAQNSHLIDSLCHSMTSSWSTKKCPAMEALKTEILTSPEQKLPTSGIFTLDDLVAWGKLNGICPYFLARYLLGKANVIVYSYYYLLDSKVAAAISQHLSSSAIVVFDEAHNIDNVCIESLSITLSRGNIEGAMRGLEALNEGVRECKQKDASILAREYQELVSGMNQQKVSMHNSISCNSNSHLAPLNGELMIPLSLLNEIVPGNIRQAEHFLSFLKRLLAFLKHRLKAPNSTTETPASFLQTLRESALIDRGTLKFAASRLASLAKTLQWQAIHELAPLTKCTEFASRLSEYSAKGFSVIFEAAPDSLLHLCCLDASIAIAPVFQKFSSVIITSGTLSPMSMYPKILGFRPCLMQSFNITLPRNAITPLVINRGNDQVPISSRFQEREDPAVIRNYGQLVVEFSRVVPDGLIVFFPSYLYMQAIITAWNGFGIFQAILRTRLIFIEGPSSPADSTISNYRAACDAGRGAILLAVARGASSEGVDFEGHYGRCVIMLGVPYQNVQSRLVRERVEWIRVEHGIRESEWLAFDAMRQASQCLGRVMRGKRDWGLMVMADARYARADRIAKLPRWIAQCLQEGNIGLSVEAAVHVAKRFFREMGQELEI